MIGLSPILFLRNARFEITWSAYGLLNAILITNSMAGLLPLPGDHVAQALCIVGAAVVVFELWIRGSTLMGVK